MRAPPPRVDRVASESHFRLDVDLSLGLDLKGGTTLRYLVSPDPATSTTKSSPNEALDRAVDTFRNRLDTLGVKEISCVPAYESSQVVIELPGVTMDESESYQKVVESLGHLEFLIVVGQSTTDLSFDSEKERLTNHLKANPGWTPPPASQMVNPPGLWSRPVPFFSAYGVRPNSLPHQTSVSSSSPRRFRSVSSPATGRSTARA